VVGVPGAKGKKIELPFWQIELYPTHGKAASRVKAMGANVSLYMIAARDGLPLRDMPSNIGKRVYRLREGQSVKVLDKVEGAEVSTGAQALPGSWYQVLSDDGTMGYVYSYAFRLYDEAKEGPPVLAEAKQALSGRVDLIFSRSWRPEYFQEMLDDGRIDLDYFSLRFGVFVDAIRRQIRIELPAASQVFNYTDVAEADGLYTFAGTPLRIKIESDNRISCAWSGVDSSAKSDDASAQADAQAAAQTEVQPESAVESYGSTGSAVFVVLSADPLETIRLESLRRQKLLGAFVDGIGSSWASTDAGKLEINKNGRFTWVQRGDSVASALPAKAGESGDIAFRLFLDPSLASSWSGVLSLRFDQVEGGAARPAWSDFLYRLGPSGLVLAPTAAAPGSLVVQAAGARAETIVLESAAK
jgi:hypothetical protein